MWLELKRLVRRLTPAEKAARELADAELYLMDAMSAKEHAESVIGCYKARISRLKAFLSQVEEKGGAA